MLSQLSADGSEVVTLGSPPAVEAAATLVSMLLLKVPHLTLATHRSDARVGGHDAEASMMGPPPTLTLQVSPNHVGLVIGAKGSNVNNVKALPGIHRVLVQDDGSILVWADSLPEAEAARRHLEIHTEHYPLRAEEVGWVIGKQGKQIVSLQQLSSSHIVIKSAGEVRDAVEAQRAAAEGGGGGDASRELLASDSSGDAHARPESGGAGGSDGATLPGGQAYVAVLVGTRRAVDHAKLLLSYTVQDYQDQQAKTRRSPPPPRPPRLRAASTATVPPATPATPHATAAAPAAAAAGERPTRRQLVLRRAGSIRDAGSRRSKRSCASWSCRTASTRRRVLTPRPCELRTKAMRCSFRRVRCAAFVRRASDRARADVARAAERGGVAARSAGAARAAGSRALWRPRVAEPGAAADGGGRRRHERER